MRGGKEGGREWWRRDSMRGRRESALGRESKGVRSEDALYYSVMYSSLLFFTALHSTPLHSTLLY
jgi:hypothetical protein